MNARQDDLSLACNYENIAVISMRKGDFLIARKYFNRVLELRKEALGTERHQDIATTYNNIAVLHEMEGTPLESI